MCLCERHSLSEIENGEKTSSLLSDKGCPKLHILIENLYPRRVLVAVKKQAGPREERRLLAVRNYLPSTMERKKMLLTFFLRSLQIEVKEVTMFSLRQALQQLSPPHF